MAIVTVFQLRERQLPHFLMGKTLDVYYAYFGAMEIERLCLCFSLTTKNPYFKRCWLFGDPSAMQKDV